MRDTVEPDQAIGHLGVLALAQALVELLVRRPVVAVDARLPELAALRALGPLAPDVPGEARARGMGDEVAVGRHLARVDVFLEQVEDPFQVGVAVAVPAGRRRVSRMLLRLGRWVPGAHVPNRAIGTCATSLDASGAGLRRRQAVSGSAIAAGARRRASVSSSRVRMPSLLYT